MAKPKKPKTLKDVEKRLSRKPTIAELEELLDRDGFAFDNDDDDIIEILPSGELRAATPGRKPTTLRQNLGGEYACV